MKFGAVDIRQARGKILAHNISDQAGVRRIRKGTLLGDDHVVLLSEIGLPQVYVAELEAGDLPEGEAATRIAACLAGEHLKLQGAATGRTNLIARKRGIIRVDQARLNAINSIQGVTVASLPQHRVVSPRAIIASIKIIPYGLPGQDVEEAEQLCAGEDKVIALTPLEEKKVALILTGRPGLQARLEGDFKPALSDRISAFGSRMAGVEFLATDAPGADEQLSGLILERIEHNYGLILVAGETASMDERDVLPRAIMLAGGAIESLGAPVDPGNLLLLGYIKEIPVVGAPGCARSRKENVIDWVLPRLLAGERLTRNDIISMGVGGLLDGMNEKPQQRHRE